MGEKGKRTKAKGRRQVYCKPTASRAPKSQVTNCRRKKTREYLSKNTKQRRKNIPRAGQNRKGGENCVC